jgi:tripartite-type tricarboxylate transporter receptor subunit TctC
MKTPVIRERTLEQGATHVGSTPVELERFVRSELATWTRIIKEAGIKLK